MTPKTDLARGRPRKVEDAAQWLCDLLRINGPMTVNAVHRHRINETDYSNSTLKRAAREANIIRAHENNSGNYIWRLPEPPGNVQDECADARCRAYYTRLENESRPDGLCPKCAELADEKTELIESEHQRRKAAIERRHRATEQWERETTDALNRQQQLREPTPSQLRDRRMRQLGLDNPIPESGDNREVAPSHDPAYVSPGGTIKSWDELG